MPNRKYSSSTGYRYGFNGKEDDDEIKGDGNQYDYGFRVYDSRLGRFLSTDPISESFPWNSSYAYAEGDPLNFIDLDGLEKPSETAQATTGINTRTSQKVVNDKLIKEAQKLAVDKSGKLVAQEGAKKAGENWLLRGAKWFGAKFGVTAGAILSDGELASGDLSPQIREKMKPYYERLTTDVRNLSENEKQAITERLAKGEGTEQDKLYAKELAYRATVDEGILPPYKPNEAHNPSSNNYNSKKSVEPDDAIFIYRGSIQDPKSQKTRWAKVGKGKDAVYHRYFASNDGTYHWSGSTAGKNKAGDDVKILVEHVPIEIRRMGEEK